MLVCRAVPIRLLGSFLAAASHPPALPFCILSVLFVSLQLLIKDSAVVVCLSQGCHWMLMFTTGRALLALVAFWAHSVSTAPPLLSDARQGSCSYIAATVGLLTWLFDWLAGSTWQRPAERTAPAAATCLRSAAGFAIYLIVLVSPVSISTLTRRSNAPTGASTARSEVVLRRGVCKEIFRDQWCCRGSTKGPPTSSTTEVSSDLTPLVVSIDTLLWRTRVTRGSTHELGSEVL